LKFAFLPAAGLGLLTPDPYNFLLKPAYCPVRYYKANGKFVYAMKIEEYRKLQEYLSLT
jgi:hypothetical protein